MMCSYILYFYDRIYQFKQTSIHSYRNHICVSAEQHVIVVHVAGYKKMNRVRTSVASSRADSQSISRSFGWDSTQHASSPPCHKGTLHSKRVQDSAVGRKLEEDGIFAGSMTSDGVKPHRWRPENRRGCKGDPTWWFPTEKISKSNLDVSRYLSKRL